jgi:hypothetical protein
MIRDTANPAGSVTQNRDMVDERFWTDENAMLRHYVTLLEAFGSAHGKRQW